MNFNYFKHLAIIVYLYDQRPLILEREREVITGSLLLVQYLKSNNYNLIKVLAVLFYQGAELGLNSIYIHFVRYTASAFQIKL